jgi:hypothetical protein
MIAMGPTISVNAIIGLPFMKATGMILDLVDKVVDCKYLDCPPFPVDFCRTSNHIPVMDKPSSTPANHTALYIQMIQEVENVERYYEAKVLAGGSMMTPKALAVHFGSRLAVSAMVSNHDGLSTASHSTADMSVWWVPPKGTPEYYNDYQANVLGKDGLL